MSKSDPSPNTCESTLFGISVFLDVIKNLKIRSSWI